MIYSENILVCIVVPLLVVLIFLRGSARQFVISFLTGMFICLIAAYISGYIGLVAQATADDTAIYFSPVIEETAKLLPVLFIVNLFNPNDETILMTAVALGSGFATFENCCYLLAVGTESLRFTLIRGFAAGVMHVMSMAVLAFGLTIGRRSQVPQAAGIVGALTLSTNFHALYNLLVSEPGISSAIGFMLPIAAASVIFYPYRRMLASWRQA